MRDNVIFGDMSDLIGCMFKKKVKSNEGRAVFSFSYSAPEVGVCRGDYLKNDLGLPSELEVPYPCINGQSRWFQDVVEGAYLERNRRILDWQNEVKLALNNIQSAKSLEECNGVLNTLSDSGKFKIVRGALSRDLKEKAESLGIIYDEAESCFRKKA